MPLVIRPFITTLQLQLVAIGKPCLLSPSRSGGLPGLRLDGRIRAIASAVDPETYFFQSFASTAARHRSCTPISSCCERQTCDCSSSAPTNARSRARGTRLRTSPSLLPFVSSHADDRRSGLR
jgi:hypothetical protein